MKIIFDPKVVIADLSKYIKNNLINFLVLNTVLILFQYVYITLRFSYLNSKIPLLYTMPWGNYQLADKSMLYIIPIVSASIFLVGLFLFLFNRFFILYLKQVIIFAVTLSISILSFSVVRIVQISSSPFNPFINPSYLELLFPFTVSFLSLYFLLPFFIEFAYKNKLVTNPKMHAHPAMLLQKPSARGGGFLYAVVFLLLSFIFVGYSKDYAGFYVSIFMVGILGLADDIQNTHINSVFKSLENPILRLFLLFVSIIPVVLSGGKISLISNPFGGVFDLTVYPLLPLLATALWLVWVMNLLSWSNGIDGQFAGIVGIASVVIALLALRFEKIDPEHIRTAYMAAISAGCAFAFTKYTWHPSKIMWGFGAMSAGLVISVLSISVQSKIATSVLILMIPFLDALITVIRRILQKKNPLSGDKGHLHHLLLARGWSVRRIAFFYWASAVFFGFVGLVSADRFSIQAALILAGVVGFFIILLNLKSIKDISPKQ